jgi:hypothetical protein
MALKVVEVRPGWFLFRRESCGFEHPTIAVKRQYLGVPPTHKCPEARQLNLGDILKGE